MRTTATTRLALDPWTQAEYTLWQGWYVYWLWCGPDMVYVGKTTNLGQRITTHANSSKRFDRVTYLELPDKDSMHELEKHEIHRHVPRYNKSGTTASEYWSGH